jgi:hypothetical protein
LCLSSVAVSYGTSSVTLVQCAPRVAAAGAVEQLDLSEEESGVKALIKGLLSKPKVTYTVITLASMLGSHVVALCSDGVLRVWSLDNKVQTLTFQSNGQPIGYGIVRVYERCGHIDTGNGDITMPILIYTAQRGMDASFQLVSITIPGSRSRNALTFSTTRSIPSPPGLVDAVFMNDKIWALWERRKEAVMRVWDLTNQE